MAAVDDSESYSPLDIMWITLFSFMLSVAVLGNTLVIWIVLAHRRMRTVTNYFLLNLSVADLTMAVLNGAPNFFYMLKSDWIFGEILCVVNNFVANFTVALCVFTMMAISIDRWIAVMRPLEPRMTKKAAWRSIFAIWISSALLASPALFYSTTKEYSKGRSCMVIWPDGKNPNESVYDLSYNVCLLVITYVVPMTAMAICYGSMSWELWGHTHIGEVTERQRNSMISKRKVVRMFIIVVLSFAICWLPYHGYFIYMYWDSNIIFKPWAQPLFLSFYFLAMSTSMINPVVYYFMNSRFRNYIQETVKNFCCYCSHHQTSELARGPNQETPPLLRHCNKYNSQSCSRSRSGDDNDHHHHHSHLHHYHTNNHHHLHHYNNHHHHQHHPRLNPHQRGLDDRMIPISHRHRIENNGLISLNKPDRLVGGEGPLHAYHHYHHHNNNNGNGVTETLAGTELQNMGNMALGGGSSAGSGSSLASTSHHHNHHNNNISSSGAPSRKDSTGGSGGGPGGQQQRKVSLYACMTQNGPAHRIGKGNGTVCNNDNTNNDTTRTTYC